VAGVVELDAFGKEAFPAALAAAGEGGATAFCAHPRPKSVLTFPGAFGGLIRAFHIIMRAGEGAATVEDLSRLSIELPHWLSRFAKWRPLAPPCGRFRPAARVWDQSRISSVSSHA
jgi:hypothetical protein